MTTIYTNNILALTKDLVFGLCVLAEGGWVAVELCDNETINRIVELVDNDPVFPFKEELQEIVRRMENGELVVVVPASMSGGVNLG